LLSTPSDRRKLCFLRLAASLALMAGLHSGAAAALDFQSGAGDLPPEERKDARIPGFDYCPPPHPPGCMEATAETKSPTECDEDVQIYIQTVFAYRECLALETERSVRESNNVIDRWKCKKTGSKRCR
jgi:hypothetical protein